MSMSREDWKAFAVLSEKLTVKDVASEREGLCINGMRPGEWAAFAIYDDDFRIRAVYAGERGVLERLASSWESGGRSRDRIEVMSDTETIGLDGGVLELFDSHFDGRWPNGLSLSSVRRNPHFEDAWGDLADVRKTDAQRFFELACHIAQPDRYPAIGSAKFGVFAKVDGDEAEVEVLRDRKAYDVVALRILPKGGPA